MNAEYMTYNSYFTSNAKYWCNFRKILLIANCAKTDKVQGPSMNSGKNLGLKKKSISFYTNLERLQFVNDIDL